MLGNKARACSTLEGEVKDMETEKITPHSLASREALVQRVQNSEIISNIMDLSVEQLEEVIDLCSLKGFLSKVAATEYLHRLDALDH